MTTWVVFGIKFLSFPDVLSANWGNDRSFKRGMNIMCLNFEK